MSKYIPTIGLEIHIELKTKTKMFCDSLNDPNEKRPNFNVCPVCLGHPGTLPTINKEAVEYVLRLGLALNGNIPKKSKFDRKNYFYPDLPKGYQISQYDEPLVLGGYLDVSNEPQIKSNESLIDNNSSGIREKVFEMDSRRTHIQRIHLEEDTARLSHTARPNDEQIKANKKQIFDVDSVSFDKNSSEDFSLVDFNRAGVPLMELVTEPDIKSGEQAVKFAKELQLIMRYLGISDADMEKGQMRVEANISLSNPSRMTSNESRIMLKGKSYDLMGLLFEVHNKLGPLYKEKNYQDAIEEILKREDISYEREKNIKLKFENLEVSDFFVDFIIENQIALEVKAKSFITEDDIRQVSRYVKSINIPLGILVNFKRQKLESKRVVNPAFENDSSLFEDNSRNALGTKVEIKNLNSFKAVGDAIDYEIKRQEEILEEGGKIIQETRGWDENKKQTFSQRQKEESHDYRYFPEPDLPPLDLTKFNLELFRTELPELPGAKRARFVKEYGLSEKQVEVLIQDRYLANYFEEAASELKSLIPDTGYLLLYNYLTSDLLGLMNKEAIGFNDLKINPGHLAHLVALIEKKTISSRMAKDILLRMFQTGVDPEDIIKEGELAQVSGEDEIKKVVKKIIEENPSAVSDYKKGKSNTLQFLVGKAMAKLKGQGNPEIIGKILMEGLTEK